MSKLPIHTLIYKFIYLVLPLTTDPHIHIYICRFPSPNPCNLPFLLNHSLCTYPFLSTPFHDLYGCIFHGYSAEAAFTFFLGLGFGTEGSRSSHER